jgi:hypothetical protein
VPRSIIQGARNNVEAASVGGRSLGGTAGSNGAGGGGGMSVCCDCCVLSGDGPINRPEESYRLWVCR